MLNYLILINHLPPCRSKPVKALFVFVTIFWMKTGRLVTVPLTAKQSTLSRHRKVWKTSAEYSICHQWFNRNVMEMQEYFLYAKKIKITTLFDNLSPLRQRSPVLENIHWRQAACALVWQPHPADTFSMLWFERKLCNLVARRYFYFLCIQQVFSSLHNIQIETLMADGVFDDVHISCRIS